MNKPYLKSLLDEQNIARAIESASPGHRYYRIKRISPSTIDSYIPSGRIGDICHIHCQDGSAAGATRTSGMISGLDDGLTQITLQNNSAPVSLQSLVEHTGKTLNITAHSGLKNMVLDAWGTVVCPIKRGHPGISHLSGVSPDAVSLPITGIASSPFTRRPIEKRMWCGIRSIDAFTPITYGQRMLLIAEPAVGKSTLLSALGLHASADVKILCLIGERGREVEEARRRLEDSADDAIIIYATSDAPPFIRSLALQSAITLAEYFQQQGEDVLLLVDSLTRHFRAERDLALGRGEPLVPGHSYPASIFSSAPALFERIGCFENGSITAFFTMLSDDSKSEKDLISEMKSLSDGHIYLTRDLAEQQIFPAIDIGRSLSRLASTVLPEDEIRKSALLSRLVARSNRDRELALIAGNLDRELSRAEAIKPALEQFICQDLQEYSLPEQTKQALTLLYEAALNA
ncbi:MAG: hypothetical protein PHC51_06000 [bacterium]|nr:hypothetical protein [bacterium]